MQINMIIFSRFMIGTHGENEHRTLNHRDTHFGIIRFSSVVFFLFDVHLFLKSRIKNEQIVRRKRTNEEKKLIAKFTIFILK